MSTRRHFIQSCAAATAGVTAAARSARAAEGAARPGVTRRRRLFNGRNLHGFYTFLREKGKSNDPDHVFTVQDRMIRVTGTEFGHFITEEEFENYHLIVEFKWGKETHPPRKDRARDSGILYHYVGPDKVWGRSVECQIIEGGTGDIILVDGASMDFDETMRPRLAGRLSEDGKRVTGGRINWYKRSPDWKDVIDFRGADEVEKPAGEWNRVEVIADGRSFLHLLNGVEVNKGTGADPARGKILFQSEGAEIFYRRIEIRPLPRRRRQAD